MGGVACVTLYYMTHKKPILLLILDGWGIRPDDAPGNAIALAHPGHYDSLLKKANLKSHGRRR